MKRLCKYIFKNNVPKQQNKLISAKIYCGVFGFVTVISLLVVIFMVSSSWIFMIYLLLLSIFIYLLLMIINKAQPGKYRRELIQELDEAKTYMQQIQLQKKQEQLKALQSQINPHFLYNTLDTIRGLAIEKESMDIANVVAALASMFKYSVDYASTNVAISDELAHMDKYLAIQCIRFPDKFKVKWIYECEKDALFRITVPKLTLQPIVENALTHGLKNLTSGGEIVFRFILSDLHFKVIISDNGSGISEEVVKALNRTFRKNNLESEPNRELSQFSIALSNIDSRIKLYCGQDYGLFVASTLGVGTEITITLPVPKGDA